MSPYYEGLCIYHLVTGTQYVQYAVPYNHQPIPTPPPLLFPPETPSHPCHICAGLAGLNTTTGYYPDPALPQLSLSPSRITFTDVLPQAQRLSHTPRTMVTATLFSHVR